MGHSSINVSLTYLRELEVAELKEERCSINANMSFIGLLWWNIQIDYHLSFSVYRPNNVFI